MIVRALLLFLIAFVALVLGYLVLRKSNQRAGVRWSFLVATVCLAVWSAGLEMFLLAEDVVALDTSSRYFYAAAAVFCPAVAIFTAYAFMSPSRQLKRLSLISMTMALLAAVYIFLVPEFIISVSRQAAPINMRMIDINVWHYWLFVVFFCSSFLMAISLGYVAWKQCSGIKQKQITVYIVGLILASMPGFVVDIVLPATGNYSLVWIGPVAVSLFLFAIMYSIIKYRMMDIKSALSRSVSYILLITTLALVYFVLAYVASLVILHDAIDVGEGINTVYIAMAIILAFVFQPIKRFFDNWTDKIFYYNEYSQAVFTREVSAILTRTSDLHLLARRINNYIAAALKAEKVTLCIPEEGVFGRSGRKRRVVVEDDIRNIMVYYEQNHLFPEAITYSQVHDESLKKMMELHDTRIIMPLIHQGYAVGVLFLGQHKSFGYSLRDVQMIEAIAAELAIAITNAQSMEAVRRLNQELQVGIDTATRELRRSNKQLQRLDEAKNEFISMASHQLRTPLTSIKGYLDMLLEGDLGKLTPTQKAVLNEAFMSSERMVQLINDFLNISRLQTGKFVISRRLTNIGSMVREEAALLGVVARQRNVKLKVKIGKNIPEMNVDVEKLRQVVMNMIDNAIYYSKENGAVQISVDRTDNDVVFIVRDRGIGVPKSEQAGLFSKFFRASNARKRRPDGTGVGLFLARKVVLLHGGSVIFESEEGKGSTFGFRLPIN